MGWGSGKTARNDDLNNSQSQQNLFEPTWKFDVCVENLNDVVGQIDYGDFKQILLSVLGGIRRGVFVIAVDMAGQPLGRFGHLEDHCAGEREICKNIIIGRLCHLNAILLRCNFVIWFWNAGT